MKTEFTAIIKRDGDWWLGWVEEIPGANAQEKTKEALLASLQEAARDILELRREEARRQAANDYNEIKDFMARKICQDLGITEI